MGYFKGRKHLVTYLRNYAFIFLFFSFLFNLIVCIMCVHVRLFSSFPFFSFFTYFFLSFSTAPLFFNVSVPQCDRSRRLKFSSGLHQFHDHFAVPVRSRMWRHSKPDVESRLTRTRPGKRCWPRDAGRVHFSR